MYTKENTNAENEYHKKTWPIKTNIYPGVLTQYDKNGQQYQAPVGWIYTGKSWAATVMKLIQKNNENLSQLEEQDKPIPEHQLRIVERNISINTINPHNNEEELI